MCDEKGALPDSLETPPIPHCSKLQELVSDHAYCPDALQGLMIVYLLVARPYIVWQLQWLEVGAHSLEMLLFLFAVGIVQLGQQQLAVSWSMACE